MTQQKHKNKHSHKSKSGHKTTESVQTTNDSVPVPVCAPETTMPTSEPTPAPVVAPSNLAPAVDPYAPSQSIATLVRKFVLSLISIKWMEYSIRRASLPNVPSDTLQIFDTRYGYSVNDVKTTLRNWGTRGRIVYLILQAIDCVGFIVAYREVLERLYSMFILNPKEMNMSWLILLLVYVDYVENTAQSMMTLAFENNFGDADWFPALVQIASTANMVKWNVAKYGALALVALFFYKRVALIGTAFAVKK